jgi:hypothetical protein
MKSFSQFLQESYLNEANAPNTTQPRVLKRDDKSPYNFRKNVGNMGIAADPLNPSSPLDTSNRPQGPRSRLPGLGGEKIKPSPGQMQIPGTNVGRPGDASRNKAEIEARKATERSFNQKPSTTPTGGSGGTGGKPPSGSSGGRPPSGTTPTWRPGGHNINPTFKPQQGPKPAPAAPSGTTPTWRPGGHNINPTFKPQQGPKPAPAAPSGTTSVNTSTGKPPTSQPKPPQGKMPSGAKPTGKFAKALKVLGPVGTAADVAFSTADEREKGSGWVRSLAKGATVAAGGLLGGTAGAIGGGGLLSAATGTAGAIGGAQLAGKAFDTVAGANARERAAMAKANRQRQAGSAVKGIGGPTSFSQRKPGGPAFMSTGVGSQRKTVQLAKTGVVQRGGQSVAGHLAFKGGKAVYNAGPSAQSLAKTSSNTWERIGRTIAPGAYTKHDAAKAQQALTKARQSDAARNKALGVKYKPGG